MSQIFSCNILQNLSCETIKSVRRLENNYGLIYFPFVAKQKWIPCALQRDAIHSEHIGEIQGSAPSICDDGGLQMIFRKTWAGLVLLEGSRAQPHRRSENLDTFMAPILFAEYLKMSFFYGQTLRARHRPFLGPPRGGKPQKGHFVRTMVAIFRGKDGGAPFTGGKPHAHGRRLKRKIESMGRRAEHNHRGPNKAEESEASIPRPSFGYGRSALIARIFPHPGGSKKTTPLALQINRPEGNSPPCHIKNERRGNARAKLTQNPL